MTDKNHDAFNAWFEETYGVPCLIDAAVMGPIIPGVLEDDPSLHGEDHPLPTPYFTKVYRSVELPPRLRTTLHPPYPEAFDGLVGRAPFAVIGMWSYSSLYWWQSNGRVRAFLRLPLGGGYSTPERDLNEMKQRLEVLDVLFRRIPAGTFVDISENMDKGLVYITSRGRTWRGEFHWSSLGKLVRRVMRGNDEHAGRLQQDVRPASVFRSVWLAMEHLADVIRQHNPDAIVLLIPPQAISVKPGTDVAAVDDDGMEEAHDEDGVDDIDEDDLNDEELDETPIPEGLLEACRAVPGGAELRWESALKDGTTVRGILSLPSEEHLRNNETRSFMEGEPGFSIAPSADVEVCWPADHDGDQVYLFDDDCMLLEECSVADIFERMVDSLGMPGWATGLDEKEASVLSRFRKELGLDPIE